MKALITGASGQDGYYLTQILASKGYEVVSFEKDIRNKYYIGDYIEHYKPDELYNLAAMVRGTEANPSDAFWINSLGTVNVLEAVRTIDPTIRVCHASSSEIFDLVNVTAQDESTPIKPRNVYGMTKAAAHLAAVNYREVYGLNVCCAIMFNHESPLRTSEYVSKRIVNGVHAAKNDEKLLIGNLDIYRDWGHARDYMNAMWLMNQQPPDDYVVATGETHSVREFVLKAFSRAGMDWEEHVVIDENYSRHNDVHWLCGNPTKLERIGWRREYEFDDIVDELMAAA